MSTSPEQPAPLRIAIIGAGIAGLTSAIALRRAGHAVTVYERSSFKNEIGAAISMPPNATRILDRWAFDWAAARAGPKLQIRIADATSLAVVHCDSFEDVECEYGSKWWTCHRVDLHGELRAMAERREGPGSPVEIRLGSKVVALNPDEGVLQLENGMEVKADLVVVADGTHSTFMQAVVGRPVPMIKTGRSVYRSLVSLERAMEIPKIREIFENETPGFFIPASPDNVLSVTYPCRSETLLNWAVLHDTKEKDESADDKNWNNSATPEEVLETLECFHPAWRELCTKIEKPKYFKVMYHEPLERICRGKAVLIGDSAHPMLPTHGQGAAIAVEEAAVFEVLFGPGTKPEEVEKRLEIFQNVLLQRVMIAQVLSNKWQGPRDVMEAQIANIDPKACIPPANTPLFGKEIRDHFYPFDAHKEAQKALELSGLA